MQSCFTRLANVLSRQRPRSSAFNRLAIPPVRLSAVGRRAFPVSGAYTRNYFPYHVTSAPSLAALRQRLKSYSDIDLYIVLFSYTVWPYIGHVITN